METSKTVFLHVGHGKTGTSAFQAYLARAKSVIESNGFSYPYPNHITLEAARNLKVTSGNLAVNTDLQRKSWLQKQVLSAINADNSSHTFIFSSENVFHHLDPLFEATETLSKSNIKVKILLSVRNPLDMLESEYQQLVKRHGYTETIDSFALSRNFRCDHTYRSSQVIRKAEALGLSYALFNYSTLRRQVISALADAIGIEALYPVESLAQETVNRSLSAAELQLVLFFNEFIGEEYGTKLSDLFVDAFPIGKRQKLAYSNDSIDKIRSTMKAPVEFLNERLQASSPLSLDYDNKSAIQVSAGLTNEQLALGKSIFHDYIRSAAGAK